METTGSLDKLISSISILDPQKDRDSWDLQIRVLKTFLEISENFSNETLLAQLTTSILKWYYCVDFGSLCDKLYEIAHLCPLSSVENLLTQAKNALVFGTDECINTTQLNLFNDVPKEHSKVAGLAVLQALLINDEIQLSASQAIADEIFSVLMDNFDDTLVDAVLIALISNKNFNYMHWIKALETTILCKAVGVTSVVHARFLRLCCMLFDPFSVIKSFSSENGKIYQLIIQGLSADLATDAIKYSSFLLKRLVDYTSNSCSTTHPEWIIYDNVKEFQQRWTTFFLIFETIQEQSLHMIEPVLPKVQSIVKDVNMGVLSSEWLFVILKRGILNPNLPVRKKIFDFVFNFANFTDNPQLKELFKSVLLKRENTDFVFGFLLKELKQAALFSVTSPHELVCQFGEMFSMFIAGCLESMDIDSLSSWIQNFINFSAESKSILTVLYLFQGICQAQTPTTMAISSAQMDLLSLFMDGDQALSLWGRVHVKNLMQKLVWKILGKHSNLTLLNFYSVCRLIYNYYPSTRHQSLEYKEFHEWIVHALPQEYLFDQLNGFIQSLLNDTSQTGFAHLFLLKLDLNSQKALLYRHISRTFTLFVGGDCGDRLDRLNSVMSPLFARLNGLHTMTLYPKNSKLNLIMFLGCFFKEFCRMSKINEKETILCKFPVFMDNIDDFLSFCDLEFVFANVNVFSVCEIEIIDQLLRILCVGHRVTWSSKQLMNDHNVARYIEPLVLGCYPPFKVLDLMDTWRSRSIEYLTLQKCGDPSSITKCLLVLSIALSCQLVLEPSGSSPLKSNQIESLLENLLAREIPRESFDGMTRSSSQNLFLKAKIECVQALLQFSHVYSLPLKYSTTLLSQSLIDELKDAVDASDSCLQVFATINTLLEISPDLLSVDQVSQAVDYCLALLKQNWGASKHFYKLFNASVDLVLHQTVLMKLQNSDAIFSFFKEIQSQSASRSGLMPRISFKFYDFISNHLRSKSLSSPTIVKIVNAERHNENSPETENPQAKIIDCTVDSSFIVQWFSYYQDIILRLALHGPTRTREKDEIKHESVFLLKIFPPKDYPVANNYALCLRDFMSRVYINHALIGLPSSTELVSSIAIHLILGLVDMINKIDFKYSGTIEHREMVRAWCTVHCLLCKISQFDTTSAILMFTKFMNCLHSDQSNGTRLYNEWAIARLFIMFPQALEHEFWKPFSDFELKAQIISSLLTVTAVVPYYLRSKTAFLNRLVTLVPPWCQSNHFTIRIFAQFSLLKALENFPHVFADSRTLDLIQFLRKNPDTQKQIAKAQKSYFLSKIHPVRDANIEFIFNKGLEYGQVIESERIQGYSFYSIGDLPHEYLHNNVLEKENGPGNGPGNQIESVDNDKSNCANLVPSNPVLVKKDQFCDETGEISIQKKIMPWQDLLYLESISNSKEKRAKKQCHSIIVAASLVSRIPNLAGLCRTCEIFNAEALVVNDLSIQKDPQFQSISVTSNQWMEMLQVKETLFKDYLMSKKRHGYALIGLEQTTTSIQLNEFDFPAKCVLVLGKEREGIPADILSLLDYLLEIPQFGIVRSLNVHVSASICVWEYTKQQIK